MRIISAIALVTLIGGHAAQAQNAPTQPDQWLKQMGAYIGAMNEFTFHADITFDHVLPSGQKLQYLAAEDVALQRPARLYVEWTGELGDRQFWYDGKAVTLYDPATPFYGSEQAPAGIDAMLDNVESQLGFSPPLADFLYSDPYRAVQANIQYSVDLGTTELNGRTCRSLAFVGKDVDWQIWIDTGPQLKPCKLLITYKLQPGEPRFSAVFSDWNFSPHIAEPIFTPQLPPGTERVPFAPVLASKQP